jgi:hypothetical protein
MTGVGAIVKAFKDYLLDANGNLKTGATDSNIDSISSVQPYLVETKTQTNISNNIITLTNDCNGVLIANDGTVDFTATINDIPFTCKSKEINIEFFKIPFSTITFSATAGMEFRLRGYQKGGS